MTDHAPDTHQSVTATGPLALKSNLVLGPNARKLASQLQNAAYNCGYEDAHPSNATTRQAKADAKCREVLAALYAECDRLAEEVERLAKQRDDYRHDMTVQMEAVAELVELLRQLAEAAEALGVNHFGDDWRSDEVQELQAATHAARVALGPNVAINLPP